MLHLWGDYFHTSALSVIVCVCLSVWCVCVCVYTDVYCRGIICQHWSWVVHAVPLLRPPLISPLLTTVAPFLTWFLTLLPITTGKRTSSLLSLGHFYTALVCSSAVLKPQALVWRLHMKNNPLFQLVADAKPWGQSEQPCDADRRIFRVRFGKTG